MIKGIQSFRTKEGGRTADKRWEYKIFEKQQDIDYFQKLDNDTLFNEEERKTIAGILKEYWIALSYSQYFS